MQLKGVVEVVSLATFILHRSSKTIVLVARRIMQKQPAVCVADEMYVWPSAATGVDTTDHQVQVCTILPESLDSKFALAF